MRTARQRGAAHTHSHLVTFRQQLVYRTDGERLTIMAGTQLVGLLIDGPDPALQMETMTLALSPQLVTIEPNPDPRLTLDALAQQTAQAAEAALAARDFGPATDRYLQAAVQYRLVGDAELASAMQIAAQRALSGDLRAQNAFLRTPEGIADFDRHTGALSDEALRQLGATLRLIVRQLGGYQYRPVTLAEAQAAWAIVRHAVAQIGNLDHGYRRHPRPAQPISPATQWVNAENLVGDLLSEPQGSPEQIADLAELAMALDPDDADSYTLLGGMAHRRGDRAAARRWYAAGVAAGERKLGAAFFHDPDRPRFWLAVETRPYMRARAALADTLVELGEADQAIAEYWGLLELNPGDNQGLRYILASLLLERHDHDRFARLYQFIATPLDDEDDEDDEEVEPPAPFDPLDPATLSIYESAYWLYPAALYHFQREGNSARARAALQLARTQNPHVIPLLLGRTVMPREDPPHYRPGSFDEAALYVRTGRASWLKTPGAVDWLRGKPPAKPSPTRVAAPAGAGDRESLRDLLDEWIRDGTTTQTIPTKKVYRAAIARLLDWLEFQDQPLIAAALTAAQINGFLDSAEAGQRGPARNRIRVWCDWLLRRGALAQNPLPLGEA